LRDLPVATSFRTCISRVESASCGARAGSPPTTAASFSASDAVTYLPPASALRAAAPSSSAALTLVR
jgi:hypothetical protein